MWRSICDVRSQLLGNLEGDQQEGLEAGVNVGSNEGTGSARGSHTESKAWCVASRRKVE